VNITKKRKQSHRYGEQTSSLREGRGNIRVRRKRYKTIRYKISYKDVLYNRKNIANIL